MSKHLCMLVGLVVERLTVELCKKMDQDGDSKKVEQRAVSSDFIPVLWGRL